MMLVLFSAAQWTEVNTGLTNLNVRAMASDGSHLYTGTEGGGVFLSENEGQSWTAINNGLSNLSITSLAISGTQVFAGTQGGGVYMTEDNGSTWSEANAGLTSLSVLAMAVSGTTVFAGTWDGGIFRSTDNGANWTAVNTGLPSAPFPVIGEFAVSGNTIYAGDGSMGNTCGVYKSTDNGNTWNLMDNGMTYLCVQSLLADENKVYSGNMGGIYHSADGAANWTMINDGLPVFDYASALATDGARVFAGFSQGGVYITADDGFNWADVSTGLPAGNYIASLQVMGDKIFAGVAGMGGHGVFVRSLSEFPAGVEEAETHEPVFTISPNPFHEQTTIKFKEYQKQSLLTLFDACGKQLDARRINGNSVVLDREGLAAGVYMLKVVNESQQSTSMRIIVE